MKQTAEELPSNPPPSNSFWRVLSYALLLGILLVLAALGGRRLVSQPLAEIEAVDPLASPPYADPSSAQADVWIVVGSSPLEPETPAFSTLDAGRFWFNLVQQVHGPARLVAASSLILPSPLDVPVLIVTRGALSAVTPQLDALQTYAQAGGLLVLEQPTGPLQTLAGVVTAQETHSNSAQTTSAGALETQGARAGVWTTLAGAVEPPSQRQAPKLGPFQPFEVPEQGISADATVRLMAGGAQGEARPALWSIGMGQGEVVGLGLDLGKLMLRHLQGTPQEDYSFVPVAREGALKDIPVPADLVRSNPEWQRPEVDLLMRTVWQHLTMRRPQVDVWRYPQGLLGAYLATHDEEGFGDRSVWMSEEEARLQVRTTFFVLPMPLSTSGAARMAALGSELALHWHRGFLGGHTEDHTVGPVIWRREAMSLARQQQRVKTLLGGTLPPFTRIHGLQWDPDFDSTFRKMVAAGLTLDSSYGPYGELSAYRFGSLEPFYPLDRQGELLPILELPFCLQDDESAPYDRLFQVLSQAKLNHSSVVPIFHVNTMAYKPSVGPLEAWMEGFEAAQAAGLWVTTVGEYVAFFQARAQTRLRMVPSGPEQWRVDVDAPASDLWISVPVLAEGRGVSAVRDSRGPEGWEKGVGVPVRGERRGRCVQEGGRTRLLLPVSRGRSTLELHYGASGDEFPDSVCVAFTWK